MLVVDLACARIGIFSLAIVLNIVAKFSESELILILLLSVDGTRSSGLRDVTRILLGRW
jgi:hypothetical protein